MKMKKKIDHHTQFYEYELFVRDNLVFWIKPANFQQRSTDIFKKPKLFLQLYHFTSKIIFIQDLENLFREFFGY